jgi:hypothetical protein
MVRHAELNTCLQTSHHVPLAFALVGQSCFVIVLVGCDAEKGLRLPLAVLSFQLRMIHQRPTNQERQQFCAAQSKEVRPMVTDATRLPDWCPCLGMTVGV